MKCALLNVTEQRLFDTKLPDHIKNLSKPPRKQDMSICIYDYEIHRALSDTKPLHKL